MFPLFLYYLTPFVLVLVLSLLPRVRRNVLYRKLPPGPFCWPILGYVPFFNKNSSHQKLTELAEKYGGLFSLYVGSRFVVIIDDFEVLKHAFNRAEFLGRPEESLFVSLDHAEESLLNMSGEHWEIHEEFWLDALRKLNVEVQDMNNLMMTEIQAVTNTLDKCQNQDIRADVVVQKVIHNISYHICFGKRFDQDNAMIGELAKYDKSLLMYLENCDLCMYFPVLKYIRKIIPVSRKARQHLNAMDRLIREEIVEHQKTLDKNHPRDFIDMFLLKMEEPGLERYFNMPKLVGGLKLLLEATSETPRIILVWFFLLMAKHTEIQKRIHSELDNVVGHEKTPEAVDRTKLPLLCATMMETMRFRNLLHLSVPRRVLRDTNICGFDIPQNTIIFHNVTSLYRNPKYWKEPNLFSPDRFLSPDHKSFLFPEYFKPFSYGKRKCPGLNMAMSTMTLFAASVMHKFKILPPDGGVNLKIKVNYANGSYHPFLKFQRR